jgi:hypothetical protein
MAAYLFLHSQRREKELHTLLSIHTLASRGDPKAVTEQLDIWERYF